MTTTDLPGNTEQRDVLVLSGTRTAIGSYGGGLKDVPPSRRCTNCAAPAAGTLW